MSFVKAGRVGGVLRSVQVHPCPWCSQDAWVPVQLLPTVPGLGGKHGALVRHTLHERDKAPGAAWAQKQLGEGNQLGSKHWYPCSAGRENQAYPCPFSASSLPAKQ